MVTYCVGDIFAKRKAFKTADGVCVDNEDVLVAYTLNGRVYCVIGKNPYAAFDVGDYISYSRSLCNRKPLNNKELKFILKSSGCRVPLCARIGRLNRVKLKEVMLASKIEIDSKRVFLNFDGLEYSGRHRRLIGAFLSRLNKYEVFAAVSDTRFIPDNAKILRYFKDGKTQDVSGLKASARPASRLQAKKELRSRGLKLSLKSIKRVVMLRDAD